MTECILQRPRKSAGTREKIKLNSHFSAAEAVAFQGVMTIGSRLSVLYNYWLSLLHRSLCEPKLSWQSFALLSAALLLAVN